MALSRFTGAALFALACCLALPLPSSAQASREGPTFGASGAWPGFAVRRPDVAYDPVNDVYLVVSGPMTHGRFLTADGVPLGGDFYVSASGAYNQTPRVAYSSGLGGFLVTWLDLRSNPNFAQVWGRLVKFGAGGAPVFPAGDFLIGAPVPGVDGERGAAVAYSTLSQRFLVVFHQYGGGGVPANDIRGQLVADNGSLVGGVINVTFDNHFQGEVGVSYSPASNQFLVGYRHFYEPSGPATIQVRTVNADTGALGTPVDLTAAVNTNVPEIAYNTSTNQFFVGWWQANSYYGRFVAPDGSVIGNAFPFVVNYGGYDSLGIAYNGVSGTFFAVFHGRAPSGFPQEDTGAQVSGTGTPDVEFDVTQTGNQLGNFNPRIAAHASRKEWTMVTSTGFAVVSGQRIKTLNTGTGPPPPPPPPPPTTVIDLSPTAAPNGSWFLAEGVESGTPDGFHTFYLLANENDVPVQVRAYFASDSGTVTARDYTIGPRSRTTISLADAAGAGAFGAVFQSRTINSDIFVARSIYFGNNLEGSTGAEATKTLGGVWLFAEGSRGGELFDNFFLLFNPTQAPVTASFTFARADGVNVQREYTVAPQRRLTVYANQIPELAGQDFSTTIQSAGGVIAERAMYWRLIGSAGTPWIGGTATLGANNYSYRWLFAEGAAAPGFETFYLLLNPQPFAITVRAVFMLEGGGSGERYYQIPARSRFTVFLNQEVGNIGGASAQFTSDSHFLAERSIYWGHGRVEGTNTGGAAGTAERWHLPEGASGGLFDTYILLGNPDVTAATVRLTLFVEGLGRFTISQLPQIVPAQGRKTIYMNSFLAQVEAAENLPPGTLVGKSFSTRIEVLSGPGIVAEHAIYWQRDGANYWRGGSAAFGIPR